MTTDTRSAFTVRLDARTVATLDSPEAARAVLALCREHDPEGAYALGCEAITVRRRPLADAPPRPVGRPRRAPQHLI